MPNTSLSDELIWSFLPATEKQNYLVFHKSAFEEDLRHAEKNLLDFPRWSIISGYYCMHNITKYFLALKFNIKLSSPDIHSKTIRALEFFVKDEKLKSQLLIHLKEAKLIYFAAERLKEKTLPALLKRGKQERGRAQYYSEDYSSSCLINSQKSAYFLDTIVTPYVNLIRGLLNAS